MKISVCVTSATRVALEETGEQRSPKKAPDRTAPPSKNGGILIVEAMTEQITPMVAAVPKEVPVRKESIAFKRNVIIRNTEGISNLEE